MSRKQFLRKSFLSMAAVPFIPHLGTGRDWSWTLDVHRSEATDEAFWTKVREQFLLDKDVVNLNNGAVGPQPLAVQDAHIELYRFSNRAPSYLMWGTVDGRREKLRSSLAEMAGCDAEEFAIDRNTTEALNTVIFGLDLERGDEVVVSDHDYPFMLNAWKQRQMRDGIVVKQVNLPLPITDDQVAIDCYLSAITTNTKVVHLTHVINWTGQIMPVEKITRAVQERGVQVVVDAAHSLAHIPLSFRQIGCDYMATSLHKWLGAPFGTGALIVKRNRIPALWPLLSAYDPHSEDIRKFELLGTRSFPAEMAVLDAVAFHRNIGTENVRDRLHYLKRYWADRLPDSDRIRFHTSLHPRYSGAMATISIDGMTGAAIAEQLWKWDRLHVGLIQWNGLDGVRISPHIYTSLTELDRLVLALNRLLSK